MYPFSLDDFTSMLKDVAGPGAKHEVYGNFRPLGEVEAPTYYEHFVTKPLK